MSRPINVTIVGTGYVGLVTGACLASLGHQITCVDIRQDVVDLVNRGEAPFFEPGLPQLIQHGLASGRFCASTDLPAAVAQSDITMIAVGTPSTADGIDLSYVVGAAAAIGDVLASGNRYHVVVVKSTVVPGTTDGIIRNTLLKHAGLRAAAMGLCMNPEFLREGSAVADCMSPDRIVIGERAPGDGDLMAALYESFHCPIIRTSLSNAELTKYTANALLALLVSFSNEIAAICERLPGTDVEAVMDGVHLDRRLSPIVDGGRVAPGILSYLRAGAGFGGSCLPKDVTALRMFARSLGVDTDLLDATMAVNERRPDQVVELVKRATGGLGGKTVAVLGVAFKAGTEDVRDSPAVALISRLTALGANVRAYDPLLSRNGSARLNVPLFESPELALRGADAVVIATACPEFREWDWESLHRTMRSPVIVDARRSLQGIRLPEGSEYWPIGETRE